MTSPTNDLQFALDLSGDDQAETLPDRKLSRMYRAHIQLMTATRDKQIAIHSAGMTQYPDSTVA